MENLKAKRIFEIPHFFKDGEGKSVRNSLSLEELFPCRDEKGFVKKGQITIRISDEKGNSKAFRLSIPEVLELVQILEITVKEQLKRISLLNIERARNQMNYGQETPQNLGN